MFGCNLLDLPPEVLGNPLFIRHPKKTQQFYECYLQHSAFHNRGTPIKADDIKDFTYKDYLWDRTCKSTSEITKFCSKDSGIEPRCRTIFHAVASWNSTVGPVAFLKSVSEKTGLPQSILDHDLDHFLAHQVCQERMHTIVKDCILATNLLAVCHNSPLRVAKVLRVKMTNIPVILDTVPNLKVIHYLRDPRAIAYSQSVTKHKEDQTRPEEFSMIARTMCDEMARDLFKRSEAEKSFPGAFLQVRYEDLVTNPTETLEKMYKFIGKQVPHESLEWLKGAFSSNKDGGRFGTQRENAIEVMNAWRKGVDPAVAKEVSSLQVCRSVLKRLNYQL